MGLTTKSFFRKADEPKPEPPKKPDFTFETSWDDGDVLDLKVADLLQKYNLPGTFYIIVDRIGTEHSTSRYMNWDEIKSLVARGFEIGSHTVTHPADLKMVHDEQLHYEIQNSKDLLETALGGIVKSFCYPRGRYDERVKDMVRRAGYTNARITGLPGNTELKDPLEKPGTIHVYRRKEYGTMRWDQFARMIIDTVALKGGYINIWGHGHEIERDKNWERLDSLFAYAKKMLQL